MEENLVLKMENINKSFPGVHALKNVYFDLKKGEVHALLGENGAGKSTLMKILTGVYKKDSGTILLHGNEVDFSSPKEAQNMGIAIIFQEFNLLPHLNVAQNIFIGRESKNKKFPALIDERKLISDTQKILDSLNLNIKPTELVKNLSVAKQQMVEIAKALSMNAEILIMDEPTAALTESEIEELFKTIKHLKSQGVAIIYISHRMEELNAICDRVTVMRDGEYVKTINFKDTNIEELITLMVGRSLKEKFPKHNCKRGKRVLEVKNLSRNNVLKNISFELYEGEILGIAGLMGAGRTELARALFGADRVDGGEIVLDGKSVKINNPNDAIKNGIGYISEDRKRDGIALGLSVEKNITLASLDNVCKKGGVIDQNREKEIARSFVENLKIKTPSLSQKVKNLSGGNQQKVVLAKWMCVNNLRVLIFDEPTRGIDVGAKVEVYNLMNELLQQGIGIIMISSELPEILGMSDRIIVMHEGRITGELMRSDATQEKILRYATGN
ncbi:sugar ABC transporter ATP-binding protein [Thermoanaerobacterium thermosaccharolyticum]|uniref:sugar ABC transporter ATP-binding protein n=1 Tax=Thermoanaerobacterium thermosaccharolyticum TaxID=1517 RepID=UPI0020A36318|nr:sugar ABC transporter ATP-binding protein [Thermoanaerobacterium thermosaccharolyticum]MCP2240323.1 ribose transport system ATP-binding protein [Thermoanaerobacterium thermosaccharolyticum]